LWSGVDKITCNSTSQRQELVVDFRKHQKPVSIRGTEVDIVEEYKYLDVHIDNKMDWTKNRGSVQERSESPVFSVVASVIFDAVVCWGSRVKAADANRINKLIRKAGSLLGVELESLVEVGGGLGEEEAE